MKKKLVISLLLILSLYFISGCNNNKQNKKQDKTPTENIKTNNNSVVIYFSATGTTKKVAEIIAKGSNSDIIEIIPLEEYKEEDLDYNSDCRANKEQNDPSARPMIKNDIDISKYDVVYLGYPIWWGTNPKIILTLLDSYDFRNKVIFPFCTSGSSGIEKSVADLRNYNPKLTIKDGKRFSSNNSQYEINDFVNRSKIEMNTLNEETDKMNISIDGKDYILNLDDNVTAKKLYELAPLDITMDELNGNEKYIYLSDIFPINPYKPGYIEKGDVMLFDTGCLVIFYKSFNTSHTYTKIGHIDNLPDLGNDSISVKLNK